MSLAYPEFRATRCTRFRFRYSECRRCLDACPHQAITLRDDGAELDPAKCQNCALCVSACHTGAWIGESYKPIELLRQAIKQPNFSLACTPSGMNADALVPCLGAVGATMIAYLGKRRIPLTLLGSHHCADCPHGARGVAQLAANLEAAVALKKAGEEEGWPWLDPILEEAAQENEEKKPAAERGMPAAKSRRQLFRRLFSRGLDALSTPEPKARLVVPDKAIRPGPYAVPELRELLSIVCERKDGKPFTIGWHEALPLMELSLQSGCTNCEACFRVCPTGAIQIEENLGDWALTFQADRCVACEVCLEVCQPRVLDAAAKFDATPERPAKVLHRLSKQRCQRCDRFFVSPQFEETCPICRDDEDAFAQIFG